VWAGTAIMAGGLALASTATRIWHLYLTHGFMFGMGSALCFYPAVSSIGHWSGPVLAPRAG
jgi:hypothetical protein